MYACVCICMCAFKCVHMHMYVHAHICVCICMCVCIFVCIYFVNICMCICVYIFACVYICIYLYVYACVCVCVPLCLTTVSFMRLGGYYLLDHRQLISEYSTEKRDVFSPCNHYLSVVPEESGLMCSSPTCDKILIGSICIGLVKTTIAKVIS